MSKMVAKNHHEPTNVGVGNRRHCPELAQVKSFGDDPFIFLAMETIHKEHKRSLKMQTGTKVTNHGPNYGIVAPFKNTPIKDNI